MGGIDLGGPAGPGGGERIVSLDPERRRLDDEMAHHRAELEEMRVHEHPWAKPGDARISIFLGRGVLLPLPEFWDRAKKFI